MLINPKLFLRYAALNIGGMVGLSLYILVDTWFVSLALGASGLAALNLSITVFSIVSGIGQMAGVGGGTDFSLRRSEGRDPAPAWMHALCFGAAASLFLVLLGLFFAEPISLLLGADEATLAMTTTYIRVTLLFSPCHILNAIFQGFVRNDGAPRLAMLSMLASSGANIILDYLFMFPLNMGMFGAVFATGLSAAISILLLCTHLRRKDSALRLRRIRFSLHEMLRQLSYGLSALIGELASAIAMLTFNLLLMGLGGYICVAAYGVIANAALVATSIFTGLGQGIQPLASHAYGAQDAHALRVLMGYTKKTVLALSTVIFAGVFFFASPIASAFNHEGSEALLSVAVPGLRFYFIGYLFAGINIAAAAFLSAVSVPVRALIISLLRSCALLIPAALLMSRLFGVNGVWFSFVATETAVCVLSLVSLRTSLRTGNQSLT